MKSLFEIRDGLFLFSGLQWRDFPCLSQADIRSKKRGISKSIHEKGMTPATYRVKG